MKETSRGTVITVTVDLENSSNRRKPRSVLLAPIRPLRDPPRRHGTLVNPGMGGGAGGLLVMFPGRRAPVGSTCVRTASHGCVLANTVLGLATGAVRSSEIPTSAASVTTARGCSEAGPGKPNQSQDEGVPHARPPGRPPAQSVVQWLATHERGGGPGHFICFQAMPPWQISQNWNSLEFKPPREHTVNDHILHFS